MRTIFLTLLTLSSFAVTQANAASIKDDMHAIGNLFKQIGSTMSDATKNQSNAAAAAQMADLFKDVVSQVPQEIQDMPASAQSAAIADYENMINQEINLATELQSAFNSNNNAGAAAIVTQMSDLKKDGHDKYNP